MIPRRPIAVPFLPSSPSPRTRAFTLLELMIAVGLIALLVGGLGYALGDTGSRSLANAQRELAGLVDTTRAQAALHATEARLCVYNTPPPGGDAQKYLRLLQVFRKEPAGSTTWIAVGAPLYLPRGVYLVPPTTTGLIAAGVIWPVLPAPISTLSSDPFLPPQPPGTAFNGATAVLWLGYTADGTLTTTLGPQTYAKLALATAAVGTNSRPSFNNPAAIRGLLLRPSGGLTAANDAASF